MAVIDVTPVLGPVLLWTPALPESARAVALGVLATAGVAVALVLGFRRRARSRP